MLKVGDRVVYRKKEGAPGSNMLNGQKGVIVYIDGQEAGVTVQFDNAVDLSATELRTDRPIRNCWYCRADSLHRMTRGRPPKVIVPEGRIKKYDSTYSFAKGGDVL